MIFNLLPKLSFFAFAAIFLTLSASCAEETFPFPGLVNSDNINVRSDTTISSAIACTLRKGERVEVVLQLYDWYKIRLPRNCPVYVRADMANCTDFREPEKTCANARIVKDRVNIRLMADEGSAILGKLNNGETVNIVREKSGWLKIEPPRDAFGWVNKMFIQKIDLPVKEKKIIPAITDKKNKKASNIRN